MGGGPHCARLRRRRASRTGQLPDALRLVPQERSEGPGETEGQRMSVTYAIAQWDKLYENSQSRKVDKLRWVPMPNHHDGKGFRRLMMLPDAVEIYGAWALIVQVASKCPTRGVLLDADGPLLADD